MANDKAPAGVLNILGASARAAALSALRAGFVPVACDLFGDTDLTALAAYIEPDGAYPEGLLGALERMPDAPWMYTGRLENRPELVERLARTRPLWGNDAAALRRATDPCALADVLRDAGMPYAEARLGRPTGVDRRWVRKAADGPASGAEKTHAYQRWVDGTAGSALYVATPDASVFLGATRQLVGVPWLHAPPLAWCGNVGPSSLSIDEQKSLERVGEIMRRAWGLRGLFGVDFIRRGTHGESAFIPIEVNPRYTGAAELIEQASGLCAVELHAACFCDSFRHVLKQPIRPQGATRAGTLAKAVLYAPESFVVGNSLAHSFFKPQGAFPDAADIPPAGRRIEKGKPVLSLFARADCEEECVTRLRKKVADVLTLVQASARSAD